MRVLKEYYDYFAIEDGKLCRKIEAYHKKFETLIFYKEYTDGNACCRNLYSSSYGGYCIAFPGDYFYRYDKSIVNLENWGECNLINFLRSYLVSEEDKVTIESVYPEFKYVLKKWNKPTKQDVMRVIPIWLEHKETEMLLAAGLEKLVFCKSFWKLSKAKKTELRLWLKANKDFDITSLRLKDLQTIIKYKVSYEEWQEYQKAMARCYCKFPFMFYKYLASQGEDIYENKRLYEDYIELVKQTEHNLKDTYWKYPKDLRAFHNKVLAEVDEIKKNKDKEKFAGLFKAIKNYVKYNQTVDGYYIFFSADQNEWYKQANILHQCIIRCDYMKSVCERKCLLAFITKDGVPVATAEIQKGKKINQFYTDEHLLDCYPNEELKVIFNKWLKKLPNNILCKRNKKAT